MDLTTIQALLEADDYVTHLEPASDELPLEHLMVLLEEELAAQLAFIPGLDEDMPGVKLLQYYVALPIDVEPAAVDELRRLLPRLNLNLPLMAFNLHDHQRFLYFRHVQALARAGSPHDGDVILEMLSLVHYLIDQSRPILEPVASGASTSAEVLAAP